MGLFSLLPILALAYAFLSGDNSHGAHSTPAIIGGEMTVEWLVIAQAIAVALVVVTSIRLARGRTRTRRRG